MSSHLSNLVFPSPSHSLHLLSLYASYYRDLKRNKHFARACFTGTITGSAQVIYKKQENEVAKASFKLKGVTDAKLPRVTFAMEVIGDGTGSIDGTCGDVKNGKSYYFDELGVATYYDDVTDDLEKEYKGYDSWPVSVAKSDSKKGLIKGRATVEGQYPVSEYDDVDVFAVFRDGQGDVLACAQAIKSQKC